ncbi:SDR family NAD(P)-dependent oxidoreductase [Streptomyces sp. NPDC054975]
MLPTLLAGADTPTACARWRGIANETTEQAPGRLAGRVCVVTGAASGIGRATALLFAREGARVVATDLDEERLATLDASLVRVVGDISREDDARRMIGTAVERFGRLDVLVANAGLIPLSDVLEATGEEWARCDPSAPGGGGGHPVPRLGRGVVHHGGGAAGGWRVPGAVSTACSPPRPFP